jgi:hypothetical protein
MAAEEDATVSPIAKEGGEEAGDDEERRRSSRSMNTEARQFGRGKKGGGDSMRKSVFEAVLDVNQLLNEAEGYLGKKSPSSGYYQSRYFVAKGHYLKYFKNEKDTSNIDYCLAAIDVKLVTITDAYEEKTTFGTAKTKCMFDIVFPDGEEKVVLKAENEEVAKRWVEALQKMKEAPLPLQESWGVKDGLEESEKGTKAGSDEENDGDAEASYADVQAQTKATLEAASLITTRSIRTADARKSSLESEYDKKALKPKSGQVCCLDCFHMRFFLFFSLFSLLSSLFFSLTTLFNSLICFWKIVLLLWSTVTNLALFLFVRAFFMFPLGERSGSHGAFDFGRGPGA